MHLSIDYMFSINFIYILLDNYSSKISTTFLFMYTRLPQKQFEILLILCRNYSNISCHFSVHFTNFIFLTNYPETFPFHLIWKLLKMIIYSSYVQTIQDVLSTLLHSLTWQTIQTFCFCSYKYTVNWKYFRKQASL